MLDLTKYGVEAGRCITKNGKPFITINKAGDTTPVEADEITRVIAVLLQRLEIERKI